MKTAQFSPNDSRTRGQFASFLAGARPEPLTRYSNWIGGEAVPPLGGGFVPRTGPGPRGADLGDWPRSGPADVERALAELSAAGSRQAPPGAALRRAASELDRDPDPSGASAAAYDLEPTEFDEYTEPLLDDLEDLPGPPRRGAGATDRPPLALHVDGSAGPLVLWARVWRALAQGRPVLLVPDPSLGPAADLAAEVLSAELGSRAGMLAVLHQESAEVTRALAVSDQPVELAIVGPPAAGEAFETLVNQARKEALAGVPAAKRPFGVGIGRGGRRAQAAVHGLQPATLELSPGDDPRAAARRVVRLAFGRDWALGGWDAQALRRVLVAPGLLSSFTECLLDRLEGAAAADPAPWPLDKRQPDRLLEARRIGLGEGATLIHEASRPSRGGGGTAILTRLVFTNVEDRMGLAQLRAPLPLLLLERAGPA